MKYRLKGALTHVSTTEHNGCYDIYQTLVEICSVALYFGLDICQIKLGLFVQVKPWKKSKSNPVLCR